jgi:hypothetical protein
MAMDIKTGRMVYLGYGKYWRSDEIVGLNPIEEGRGPGRRTEVYTGSRPSPMIASRSERAILQDMVTAPEEIFRMEEARSVIGDLLDAMTELSPARAAQPRGRGRGQVPVRPVRLIPRTILSRPRGAADPGSAASEAADRGRPRDTVVRAQGSSGTIVILPRFKDGGRPS